MRKKADVSATTAEEDYANAPKPAVIFDFDGTLMDTDSADIVSYRALFDKYKRAKKLTPAVEDEILNLSSEKVMEKYFPDKNAKKLIKEFDAYQNQHLTDLIQPMHGVTRLLGWLKDNGYKTAVISYRSQKNLTELLATRGLTESFDAIVGTKKAKDTELVPDDIIRVCDFVKAEHCIYISSNPNNIEAAKKAGAYTVAYVSDSSRTNSLIEAQADFNTADMGQISKLAAGEPYWLAYELAK